MGDVNAELTTILASIEKNPKNADNNLSDLIIAIKDELINKILDKLIFQFNIKTCAQSEYIMWENVLLFITNKNTNFFYTVVTKVLLLCKEFINNAYSISKLDGKIVLDEYNIEFNSKQNLINEVDILLQSSPLDVNIIDFDELKLLKILLEYHPKLKPILNNINELFVVNENIAGMYYVRLLKIKYKDDYNNSKEQIVSLIPIILNLKNDLADKTQSNITQIVMKLMNVYYYSHSDFIEQKLKLLAPPPEFLYKNQKLFSPIISIYQIVGYIDILARLIKLFLSNHCSSNVSNDLNMKNSFSLYKNVQKILFTYMHMVEIEYNSKILEELQNPDFFVEDYFNHWNDLQVQALSKLLMQNQHNLTPQQIMDAKNLINDRQQLLLKYNKLKTESYIHPCLQKLDLIFTKILLLYEELLHNNKHHKLTVSFIKKNFKYMINFIQLTPCNIDESSEQSSYLGSLQKSSNITAKNNSENELSSDPYLNTTKFIGGLISESESDAEIDKTSYNELETNKEVVNAYLDINISLLLFTELVLLFENSFLIADYTPLIPTIILYLINLNHDDYLHVWILKLKSVTLHINNYMKLSKAAYYHSITLLSLQINEEKYLVDFINHYVNIFYNMKINDSCNRLTSLQNISYISDCFSYIILLILHRTTIVSFSFSDIITKFIACFLHIRENILTEIVRKFESNITTQTYNLLNYFNKFSNQDYLNPFRNFKNIVEKKNITFRNTQNTKFNTIPLPGFLTLNTIYGEIYKRLNYNSNLNLNDIKIELTNFSKHFNYFISSYYNNESIYNTSKKLLQSSILPESMHVITNDEKINSSEQNSLSYVNATTPAKPNTTKINEIKEFVKEKPTHSDEDSTDTESYTQMNCESISKSYYEDFHNNYVTNFTSPSSVENDVSNTNQSESLNISKSNTIEIINSSELQSINSATSCNDTEDIKSALNASNKHNTQYTSMYCKSNTTNLDESMLNTATAKDTILHYQNIHTKLNKTFDTSINLSNTYNSNISSSQNNYMDKYGVSYTDNVKYQQSNNFKNYYLVERSGNTNNSKSTINSTIFTQDCKTINLYAMAKHIIIQHNELLNCVNKINNSSIAIQSKFDVDIDEINKANVAKKKLIELFNLPLTVQNIDVQITMVTKNYNQDTTEMLNNINSSKKIELKKINASLNNDQASFKKTSRQSTHIMNEKSVQLNDDNYNNNKEIGYTANKCSTNGIHTFSILETFLDNKLSILAQKPRKKRKKANN